MPGKWVAYVVGMDKFMHCLLYSTARHCSLDPLQLGKDPSKVTDRWIQCQSSIPWIRFDTAELLLEFIGEYRTGEKGLPHPCHVQTLGAAPDITSNCDLCRAQ